MAAIPPKLEPEILAKAGEGWGSRQIAEWLHTVHGVKTSFKTVSVVMKRVQTERAVVAKAVLRTKLAGSLTTDLDRIEKHASQLDELAQQVYDRIVDGAHFARQGGGEDVIYVDPLETYSKAIEQLRKVTETKLKYSGADTPDENVPRPVIVVPPETDE